jgi:hypothetical protein
MAAPDFPKRAHIGRCIARVNEDAAQLAVFD